MSDRALLDGADRTAKSEREAIVDMVCYIAALETKGTRKAYGYSSMFEMCVRRWKYSREAAAQRTKAARVLVLFNEAAAWLRSGDLSLCAVSMLEPYVKEHGLSLIQRAVGKTAAEVGRIIAEIDPQAEPADLIRTIAVRAAHAAPKAASAGSGESAAAGAILSSLPVQGSAAPGAAGLPLVASSGGNPPPDPADVRVLFKFVASDELRALIQRARDLLWHKYPFGDLEFILRDAMLLFVADLEKDVLGVPDAPRRPATKVTRRIPKWVRRLVWERDGGRCTFVYPDGTVCGATAGLEFDHIKPWAEGGSSEDPDNLRILCDGHNRLEGERRFGPPPVKNAAASRAARPPS